MEFDAEAIEGLITRHRSEGWMNVPTDIRGFVFAYMETYSYVKAADAIGKPGQGLKYFRNPLVVAYISDLQDRYYKDNIITENFVRQKLLELIPKLAGEEPIDIVGRNGEIMTAPKFHAAELVAALRDLSKFVRYVESVEGVEDSLVRQAMGGSTEATKFYLKNKKPTDWKEKVETAFTGADGGPPVFQMVIGGASVPSESTPGDDGTPNV